MSLNFNFLKNANNVLYELGKSIEEQIYSAPSAVLCEGTAFLDNLLIDIYEKMDMEYDTYEPFFRKIEFLSQSGIIGDELKKELRKAAAKRNSMHGKKKDAAEYLNGNKLRAVNIHRHLFNASFLYYREFYDEKAVRPNYIHPKNLHNLSTEHCVICGRKVKTDSIYCSHCRWEIGQLQDLKTLINDRGYENPFRMEDLLRLGFEKGKAKQLLRELQDQNLIRKIDRIYRFNTEEIMEYQERIERYFEIEGLVYRYSNRDITLKEIKESDAYILGKEGQEPYINFHFLIAGQSAGEFLEKYQYTDLAALMETGILAADEFQNELIENDDFANILEDIKGRFLELKKLRKSEDEIKKQLFINDDIYEMFENDSEIQHVIGESRKQQYLNSLMGERSYEEALRINGITARELEEYLQEDPEFKAKYNMILSKRKEKFIRLTDKYDLKKAFKESRLTRKQLEEAYVRKSYDSFYTRLNQILRNKYLNYRREGKSANAAAKKCGFDLELAEGWMKIPEFRREIEEIRYQVLLHGLEHHDCRFALNVAGIGEKEFVTYLNNAWGEEDNGILKHYEENILPEEFERFIKAFGQKDEKTALKGVLMDSKLLKRALCSSGEYYTRYLDCKIDKFVRLSTKYRRTTQARRKSSLTMEEYERNRDYIDRKIGKYRKDMVLKGVKYHGKTVKQAAKSVKTTIDEVYKWYGKGQYSVGECRDFADQLKMTYIDPGMELLKNGKIREFVKRHGEDLEYWKRLNIMNSYNDIEIGFEVPEVSAC